MESVEVKEVLELPNIEEGHIFNTPEFQCLKGGSKKSFALFKNDIPISRIWFELEEDQAISGYGSTFGSFDITDNLEIEVAQFFIKEVLGSLKNSGIKKVVIKHWPLAYSSTNDYQLFFKEFGFEVVNREVDQHIVIGQEDFYYVIRNNQRSRLNQSSKRGFTFRLLGLEELQNVYDLIDSTLSKGGHNVSMSFNDLKETIGAIPDKYLLFGLFDRNRLIAASVSVRISNRVLYNFYHADDFEYRSSSPMVMLIENIYNYCQRNKVEILDLGISSDKEIINKGLFKFKENLGCLTSDKCTYYLKHD